jgi:hypothetical protein
MLVIVAQTRRCAEALVQSREDVAGKARRYLLEEALL